ncbi:hypothetical protein [Streptomyces cinnamoneus]|uniref:Uncharacterized protein n=1 Tax=Streptomyces cinnamoneus TaxID=53446 RepID=A0A918TQ08_STRCJ|nr:hypothetical protein [Streptomyces cinnamoneus]GHC57456.1 hypothetical protein GCM10010507_37620 [Streptomyces cinnamoneus]
MQREEAPEPEEDVLSTDDLAGAGERDADGGTGREPGVPTFPGESTPTAGETAAPSAREADAGTATGAEAATGTATDAAVGDEGEASRLLDREDAEGFQERWQDVQTRFVDDPREAVHTADALVAEVMQTLAATFAQRKQDLEGQWNRGEEVDTEELRVALQHYRSFFNRLLTT